jgi:hypothetical protein
VVQAVGGLREERTWWGEDAAERPCVKQAMTSSPSIDGRVTS